MLSRVGAVLLTAAFAATAPHPASAEERARLAYDIEAVMDVQTLEVRARARITVPAALAWSTSEIRLDRLSAGEGPDLAACARSPILRTLSRCVRHPGPASLPGEVREWARQAFGADDSGQKKAA